MDSAVSQQDSVPGSDSEFLWDKEFPFELLPLAEELLDVRVPVWHQNASSGPDNGYGPSSSGRDSCSAETLMKDGVEGRREDGTATREPEAKAKNEEEEKKKKIRLRNRESAQNSRKRKKMQHEELELRYKMLEKENDQLRATVSTLMTDNMALRQQLSAVCSQSGLQPPPQVQHFAYQQGFPFAHPLGVNNSLHPFYGVPTFGGTPKLPLPPFRPNIPPPADSRTKVSGEADKSSSQAFCPQQSQAVPAATNTEFVSSGSDSFQAPCEPQDGISSSVAELGTSRGEEDSSEIGSSARRSMAHGSSTSTQNYQKMNRSRKEFSAESGHVSKRVRTVAAAAIMATFCTLAAFLSQQLPNPATFNGVIHSEFTNPQYLDYGEHSGARSLSSFSAQEQALWSEFPALPPGDDVRFKEDDANADVPGSEALMLEGHLVADHVQTEQQVTEKLALGKLKEIAPIAVVLSENTTKDSRGLFPDLGGWANFSDLIKDSFVSVGLHSPTVCSEVFRFDASSIPNIQKARQKLAMHFASLALFRGRSPGPLPLPPIGDLQGNGKDEEVRSARNGWDVDEDDNGEKAVGGSGNWTEDGVVVSVLVPAKDGVDKSGIMTAVSQLYIVVLRPLATYVTFACSLQQPVFV